MKIFTIILMTAISSLHASNLYDHKLQTIDGEDTSLSEHKDLDEIKVIGDEVARAEEKSGPDKDDFVLSMDKWLAHMDNPTFFNVANDLLVNGIGEKTTDLIKSIENSYTKGLTDEFIEPIVNTENNKPIATIEKDDVVIFFNFSQNTDL